MSSLSLFTLKIHSYTLFVKQTVYYNRISVPPSCWQNFKNKLYNILIDLKKFVHLLAKKIAQLG